MRVENVLSSHGLGGEVKKGKEIDMSTSKDFFLAVSQLGGIDSNANMYLYQNDRAIKYDRNGTALMTITSPPSQNIVGFNELGYVTSPAPDFRDCKLYSHEGTLLYTLNLIGNHTTKIAFNNEYLVTQSSDNLWLRVKRWDNKGTPYQKTFSGLSFQTTESFLNSKRNIVVNSTAGMFLFKESTPGTPILITGLNSMSLVLDLKNW